MITASFKTRFGEETDVPVINPGGWFGKAWIVEIGVGNTAFFYIVEADGYHDAENEFSDSEKYGHMIHVSDEDSGDYPEDQKEYNGSGRHIDTSNMMIHGPCPSAIRYHGDNLPSEGVTPEQYMDQYIYDQHDE